MNGIGQTGHSLGCSVVATGKCTCGFPPPTEMTSLTEIKARLAAIEQGQGVLCERLDTIKEQFTERDHAIALMVKEMTRSCMAMETGLKQLQGAALYKQFVEKALVVAKHYPSKRRKKR